MEQDHARSYWREPVTTAALPAIFNPDHIGEFQLLANYLPTLCWLALADGYIVWYNQRWHDYCGTTPQQMEGWGWQEVHDPEALPDVIERWQSCIADGDPFEMVFPLKGADGRFRPFLTRIVPLRDAGGNIVRWFGVNTEIGAQLEAEAALRASEAKFSTLTDAMPQMVWSTQPDGHHDYYNAQWYEFTGVPVGSTDGEGWAGMFHAEDQPRAWARWRHSLETGEPYEVEYRLRRHDGEYRWTLGRALPVRDDAGEIIRWIGTCTDIHDAKLSAEENEVLNRELSHRIKNIFAVIAGLLNLTGKSQPALRPMMSELISRITALGRAHNFARPHSELSRPSLPEGQLGGLLMELLSPYQSTDGSRIDVQCEEIECDDKGATPLALVFHELATNSAKYGALSAATGHLRLSVRRMDADVEFVWTETGGPPIANPPAHTGFGSELAKLAVEKQLGGQLVRTWKAEGLVVAIRVRQASLYRS